MYAKVTEGIVTAVGLPEIGTLADGRVVSGFDLLDSETLKIEGWLPLEYVTPTYDRATQEIVFANYDIQTDKIIVNQSVVLKPVVEPITPEPTDHEVLDNLIVTLVDKGVLY